MQKETHVNEILGNHIPVDEAKILSNGRITCLICVNRPIFDTIGVLVSHRRGKKHASELNKYLRRKGEIAFENLKRKQISDSHSSSVSQTLGKSSKISKFKRKPTLELPATSLDDYKSSNKLGDLNTYLVNIQKKPSFKRIFIDVKERCGPVPSKKPLKKTDVEGKQSLDVKVNCTQTCDARRQHEGEMHMSGWLKDAAGNWIKDPNAEFDSDEDVLPL